MDALYENLENYEDENVVDELKRENGLLKRKLEEYSVSMDKLQKEFNILSSEFKKLENNYSSLLKTAKEEIERKTQIITKLNIEKDMVVLNAIQNKNFQLRRNRAPKPANGPNTKDVKSKIKDVAKTKETPLQMERTEQNRMPSEETVTSNSTDITPKPTNTNIDKWTVSKPNDSKENISNPHKVGNNDTDVSKSRALSIKNRRKSMPAIRCEPKFSSDEEDEVNNRPLMKSRYEAANCETKHNIVNRGHNEAFRNRFIDDHHRVSEASSMDDKYSSHHDKKDFRNRGRFMESEKFRGRDRNDGYRFKRHYSPERFRRNTRNPPDNHYLRQEYGRHRLLESPPPDKYNYQRPPPEPRPRYEEFYNFDRKRDRHEYPGKHKLINDPEESSNKKRRNNSNTYYEEEKKWDSDKLPVQSSIPMPVHNIEHISCQSPDYTIPDLSCSQPREIRHTASTKLEDPRRHSKKYLLQPVNNGTVLLSASGWNVDLKMLDTSNWKIEHVDVPKALRRRPSQCSEDLVKDIYMDIENPVSNMSVESGEILSCATDDERPDKCFREAYIDRPVPKTVTENTSTSDDQDNKLKEESAKTTKYKIPKLRKDDITVSQPRSNKREINEDRNKNVTAINYKETQSITKGDAEIQNSSTKSLQQKRYNLTLQRTNTVSNDPTLPIQENLKSRHTNKISVESGFKTRNVSKEPKYEVRQMAKSSRYKNEEIVERHFKTTGASHEPSLTMRELPISCKYSDKEIVEGDLELSDETSDCVDLPKKSAIYVDDLKTGDIGKVKNIFPTIGDSCKSNDIEKDEVNVNKNSFEYKKDKQPEINASNKKQKHKKLSQKSSSKDRLQNEKTDLNAEKRTKSKREKGETKQINAKLSELFGDSSSLITPEDLGININTQIDNQSSAKYVPVCEDAQDAVDLITTGTSDRPNFDLKCDDNSKPMDEDKDKNNPNNIRDKIICKIPRIDVEDKRKKSKKREDEIGSTNSTVIMQPPPVMEQSEIQVIGNSSNIVSKLESDNIDDVINCNKIPSTDFPQLSHKSTTLAQALATSTPHKLLQGSIDAITNTILSETSCENNNANHDKVTRVDSNTISSNTIAESSNTDTMDSQTDTDVPDVRIFVTRRRRLMRKSKQ